MNFLNLILSDSNSYDEKGNESLVYEFMHIKVIISLLWVRKCLLDIIFKY